jgi:hypothetical protein
MPVAKAVAKPVLQSTIAAKLVSVLIAREDAVSVGAWARCALALALGSAVAVAAQSRPTQAANFFEKNGYLTGPRFDSDLPACDNWWTLSTIQRRFATKESRFWNSDLRIVNFDQIKEVAYRPWVDGTIPRRFCAGKALISDGHWRTVKFSIVEDGRVIGVSWGVQWCVVGIDRNWANSPDCKAAGP